MAIVKLSKITLYGREQHRSAVLRQLQELGCVHLDDLRGATKSQYLNDTLGTDVLEAIKYLASCPDQRPSTANDSEYDRDRITRRVLINQRAHQDLREERVQLKRAIAETEAWGDFQMADPATLNGLRLWLYRLRHRDTERLAETEYAWQIISSNSQFDFVAVVSAEQPQGIVGRLITLDPRSQHELKTRLETIEGLIERLDLERIGLTRWTARLTADVHAAEDERRLFLAANHALCDGPIFALRGWAPTAAVADIERFAREHALALTVEAPSSSDTPPTLLSNPTAVAGAEGAVTFYTVPSYTSWDPTWLMYASFSLFFAMIMADAGYGVLMAIGFAVFSGKLRQSESGRRMYGLVLAIVVLTIAYGVLIGSYFGASPPAGSLLDRLVWKRAGDTIMNDQPSMMLLAASIGVFHLMIANLINAYRAMGTSRALGHLGWAFALVGGLVLAIAKMADPPLMPWIAARLGSAAETFGPQLASVGWFVLIGGLSGVFLFTSDRPLFSSDWRDWAWRPLEGVLGLTNVSKAFGDALSYLRLFALGLASAKLAVTFNGLASEAMEISGIGILVGSLIFLAGHTLNLMLGIVGGVVHGLRLNCIEFFSWSLTDEGYPFRAFCKKADR